MIITGGIDEVGTGALAGPFISSVATFRDKDLALLPSGVTDSKKCTKKQRGLLYMQLCRSVYDVGIGWAWPWEIDLYGHTNALQLCYTRALEELHKDKVPDLLYVDGVNKVISWSGNQVVEPKADVRYLQVSVASIIAKVFRDTLMNEYSKDYPSYGFNSHYGYGTTEHIEAIKKYGLLVDNNNRSKYIHRLLFCKKLIPKERQSGSC